VWWAGFASQPHPISLAQLRKSNHEVNAGKEPKTK
jgi:hypothetical protein